MVKPKEILPQGTVIEGYRLERCIGQGGYGVVYEAIDKMGRHCALKLLEPLPRGNWYQWLEEARLLAKLHDPHIVHVYQAGLLLDGRAYVVMELFGKSLREVLKPDFPCHLELCIQLIEQVLCALVAAQKRRIVHGDIKEDNILVNPQTHEIRLCDFGTARSMGALQDAHLQGSLYYLAPERFLGLPPDARSDLYALGVVFYRLCCGRYPLKVPGDDVISWLRSIESEPLERPAGVPEPLGEWGLTLLKYDPGQRPQSAAAALRSFKAAVRNSLKEKNFLNRLLLGCCVGALACGGLSFGLVRAHRAMQEARKMAFVESCGQQVLYNVSQLCLKANQSAKDRLLNELALLQQARSAESPEPPATEPAAIEKPVKPSREKRSKERGQRPPKRSKPFSPFVLPEDN